MFQWGFSRHFHHLFHFHRQTLSLWGKRPSTNRITVISKVTGWTEFTLASISVQPRKSQQVKWRHKWVIKGNAYLDLFNLCHTFLRFPLSFQRSRSLTLSLSSISLCENKEKEDVSEPIYGQQTIKVFFPSDYVNLLFRLVYFFWLSNFDSLLPGAIMTHQAAGYQQL